MPKSSLTTSIAYYSVKAFAFFLQRIPPKTAVRIGGRLGHVYGFLAFRRRQTVHANLREAFAQEKSPAEIQVITGQFFCHLGKLVVEILRAPCLNNPEEITKYITVEGDDLIREGLGEKKGVILLTSHFGNWEMANVWFSRVSGLPYKAFVKKQEKNVRLNELLNAHRGLGQEIVLDRGSGTKRMIAALKENGIMSLVFDQGGRDGTQVPFFGRNASMATGALRLAVKYGSPLIFCIALREGELRHRLVGRADPGSDALTQGSGDAVETCLKANVGLLEEYIRKHPEQYLWTYKHWKFSDEARIVILTDGRTGHLRQSESVARDLCEVLKEKRSIRARIETVPVEFRKPSDRLKLKTLLFFLPKVIQLGRMTALRDILTDESFQAVSRMKADYLISCGALTRSLSPFLAMNHRAKTIHLLSPGIFGPGRFDLNVIPAHDVKAKGSRPDSVVVTKAALNLITPEYLKEQRANLLKRFTHLQTRSRMVIGVFLGGQGQNVYLSEYQIKILLRQLTEAAGGINADLLVTTSRRTSPRIEKMIHKALKKHRHCPLLVLANQDNVPEAVGGILGMSDMTIVSGDSISMVSEAAAAGNRTIAFYPEMTMKSRPKDNKHYRFLRNLDRESHIVATDIKSIGRVVYDMAKGKIKTQRLDESGVIREALKKVL